MKIPWLNDELIDSLYLEDMREPAKRGALDSRAGKDAYEYGARAVYRLICNHLGISINRPSGKAQDTRH